MKHHHKAFTLVELLVVIGIIAVLISILLPTLIKAKSAANRVACLSNQKQLMLAATLFAQEHKGYMPKHWGNCGAVPSNTDWGFTSADQKWGFDYVLLSTQKLQKQVFRCPGEVPTTAFTRGTWTPGDEDDIPGSYKINASNQYIAPSANGTDTGAYKLTQLRQADKAIVFVDGTRGWGDAEWHQVSTWESSPEGRVTRNFRGNVDWARHGGLANYAFADGHCETLGWADTWQVFDGDGTHQFSMWRQIYVTGLDDQPDSNWSN